MQLKHNQGHSIVNVVYVHAITKYHVFSNQYSSDLRVYRLKVHRNCSSIYIGFASSYYCLGERSKLN